MTDYDKALTDYILAQLNAQDSELQFDGGYIYYKDEFGKLATMKQDDNNMYNYIETDSVPVSFLGYVGEIQPIPNIDQIKYTIPIQIYVETHKVKKVTDAIKKFIFGIKDLTPTLDSLVTVFNATPLDTSGGMIIQAGKQLIPVNFTIFSNATSDSLIYLNTMTIQIKKIGGTLQNMKVLSGIIQLATNTDDIQTYNKYATNSYRLGAVWSLQASVYLNQANTLELEILQEIMKGESGQTYNISINTGTFTFNKDVIIFSANNPLELGTPTIHTITFKEV